jgi:hypothetical protein
VQQNYAQFKNEMRFQNHVLVRRIEIKAGSTKANGREPQLKVVWAKFSTLS